MRATVTIPGGSLLFFGAVLVASGCANDGRSSGRDGGRREGGIMLMDGGSTGTDGGSTGTDGGGGMCRPSMVPAWTMPPPCNDQLLPCLQACPMGDNMCFSSCFGMQPQECNICFNGTLIKCINEAGCQEDWNCFSTCTDDNCTDAMGNIDRTCVDTMCSAQRMAFGSCADGLGETTRQGCGRLAFQTCVPAPMMGGGGAGGS